MFRYLNSSVDLVLDNQLGPSILPSQRMRGAVLSGVNFPYVCTWSVMGCPGLLQGWPSRGFVLGGSRLELCTQDTNENTPHVVWIHLVLCTYTAHILDQEMVYEYHCCKDGTDVSSLLCSAPNAGTLTESPGGLIVHNSLKPPPMKFILSL